MVQINKQVRGHGWHADMPRLLGGNLCLDFINSVEDRRGSYPIEILTSYSALVAWGTHVGILSEQTAQSLRHHAAQQPERAAAVHSAAIALREGLFRVFLAIAHEETPASENLAQIQRAYIDALSHATLRSSAKEYRWHWLTDETALDCILWPIAQAAIELLCSTTLARVKECPGANDCGWLFLDTSKNGTRRWCSMEGCGSRVKMRRQYARKKTTSAK